MNFLATLFGVWAASLFALLAFGCATSGFNRGADGSLTVFALAAGEGSLASVCFDTDSSVESIKSAFAKLTAEGASALTPEQIDAARYAQYPGGVCVAARGSSISKELESLIKLYIYALAADVAGEAVGGAVDGIADLIAK